MFQVQNLTNAPKQIQTLVMPDGSQIAIELYFISLQLGWFINSLVYKNFVLTGLRVTNSPNMIYQFRNKVPFGIACFSSQDREPTLIDDFASGASKLYILTADEVDYYTRFLSGQV